VLDIPADEALNVLLNPSADVRFERLAKALPRPLGRSPLVKPSGDTSPLPTSSPRLYTSGSEEVQALAMRLLNQKQTFEAFRVAALDGAQLTEAGRSSVAKHDGPRWLKSNWQKAEEHFATNPRSPAEPSTRTPRCSTPGR
jgi:hypothetical protein